MKPAGIDSDFARACFQSQQAVLPECARPRAQQSPNCNGARNHREPPVKPRCSGRGRPHSAFPRSSRGDEAQIQIGSRKSEMSQSLLTSAVSKERGARPPRALFSAPSRKTRAQGNVSHVCGRGARKDAVREGAASHARGGRAPQQPCSAVVSTAGCRGVSPPATTPDETSGEPAGEDARATHAARFMAAMRDFNSGKLLIRACHST